MMTIVLIAIAACAATLVGGGLALRFKDQLHLILGFSAGAVIGVAFFDLLPEAFRLGLLYHESGVIASYVAIGFLFYLILDRGIAFFFHAEHNEEHAGHIHISPERGILGASMLSFHSLLDGVAIGLSFQVAPELGMLVAVAVLAHDFSDGINTVSMIVRHGGTRPMRWLMVDALAPVVGILLASCIAVPEQTLALLLSVFTGFFLYIGASDLIPESHHAHPKFLTTAMTIGGAALMYFAIFLV